MDVKMTCVVMGDGAIALRCCEILHESGIVIRGVISNGESLVSWTKEKNIRLESVSPAAFKWLAQEPFDFLFSIFNVHVLPASVLALPRLGAINYHDALLPRYAGLYAPSWAVLHREQEHGVTWHLMTDDVDAGDILKQRRFRISGADSALQVNQRCFEAAVGSFEELVEDLLEGRAERVPQDLSRRTYFPAEARPRAACILDWRQTTDELTAVVRALDFGPFKNPLGLPKIMLPAGGFLCATQVEHSAFTDSEPPGTLLRIDDDSLVIATNAGSLTFSSLFSPTGIPFSSLRKLAFGLQLDQVLPVLSASEADEIHEINRRICRHESFWSHRLETLRDRAFFVRGLFRTNKKSSRRVTRCALPPDAIKLLDAKEKWSTAEIVISAIGAYLMRMYAEESLDLGWMVEDDRVKGKSGLFAACVPFRISPHPEQSFEALLAQSREEFSKLGHRVTFAQDLIARTPALRETDSLREGYRPSIVVSHLKDNLQWAGESCGAVVFVVPESGTEVEIWFDDEPALSGEMENGLEAFATLLGSLVGQIERPIGTAEILSAKARAEVLVMSAGPRLDFNPEKAVHSLIEEQAARNPENIAVEFQTEKITYVQLNAAADRLADCLRREGIRADNRVALISKRSVETIVAMIAILKSGACYVPIDPADPPSRIVGILRDVSPRLVFADSTMAHLGASLGIPTILLGAEEAVQGTEFVPPVSSLVSLQDLAYVICTSGSSGTPKGVMVEHHSLANYTRAATGYFEITSEDRVLQFASLSFDACGEEIYPCLTTGATLVLRTGEMIESGAIFLRQCADLAITVLDLPTAYWRYLVEAMDEDNLRLPASVRLLIIGGEAASVETWDRWRAMEKRVRVVNTYGPTEGTIVSTWCDLARCDTTQALPIGKPVPNTAAYVLDARQQLLPIGGIGELYLGGANVARGYLNRPEAGAAGFVTSLISEITQKRFYRTGDRVRFRSDGNLEFLGRFDTQLKIRGFRIETAEIEAALDQHPRVRECVVISRKTGGNIELWAFLVPREDALNLPDLRAHLREKLPGYMIPARLIVLPSLPLLSSGKVDRGTLQKWEDPGKESSNTSRPTTPMEKELVCIWREVLQSPNVGVSENFFDLGGHSLAAVAINGQVARTFGVEVTLQWLLGEATIEALAREIDAIRPVINLTAEDRSQDDLKTLTVLFEQILQSAPLHHYADLSVRILESGKTEELISAIQFRFGVKLSHCVLLEKATIAQITETVNAIRSKTGLRRWTSLIRRNQSERIVVLREGEDQPGLFVCPGGWTRESELVVFAAMLPYLPRNLPVHGLKHDFAIRSSRVAMSVETVARHFLSQMLQTQPEGAFHIIAECVSLTVGLEIAHQLTAAGRTLGQLILLDPTKLNVENLRLNSIYQKLPRKVRKYYEMLARSSLRPYEGDVHVICPEEVQSVRERMKSWKIFREENLTVSQVRGDHRSYIREYRADVARLIDQTLLREPGTQPRQ